MLETEKQKVNNWIYERRRTFLRMREQSGLDYECYRSHRKLWINMTSIFQKKGK